MKFKPIFKERIWGGSKLKSVLGKAADGEGIGESWELSGVPGDASVLENGIYAGQNLHELINDFPEPLLGADVLARFGMEFPILVKFIDARLDLSIQLHPGDELARARHNSFGKTEMWYIMDADPGAELIVGFKKDVTREEYQEALQNSMLTELLHYQQVTPGDAFYINSGKIHAIGAGILLAEIQQSSDVTYRVYDFDRRDASGNLRELHTELALDALDYERRDDFVLDYQRKANIPNTLADSPYFTTRYLRLDQDLDRSLGGGAFTVYLCVGGAAEIRAGAGSVQVRTGETILLPAACGEAGILTKGCELLEVTV